MARIDQTNTTNIAQEILSSIIYATIATASKDGEPWNSPVMACFDENLNMYWDSWVNNQHSLNIEQNNRIFIVVYDSTKKPGTALKSGVYIKAIAYQINDIKEVKKYYKLRENVKPITKRGPEYFLDKYPRRVYKAVAQKVWLNDAHNLGDAWVDTRTEVPFKNINKF